MVEGDVVEDSVRSSDTISRGVRQQYDKRQSRRRYDEQMINVDFEQHIWTSREAIQYNSPP